MAKTRPKITPKENLPSQGDYTAISQAETEKFIELMETGFLAGEATKKGFITSRRQKIGTRWQEFRITMAYAFLPEDYRVVHRTARLDHFFPSKEFKALLQKLWDGYEPSLGKRLQTISTLQVEAPDEEDTAAKPVMASNLTLHEDGAVSEKEEDAIPGRIRPTKPWPRK